MVDSAIDPGLFAVDPGGTTGYALFTPEDGWYAGQAEGRWSFHRVLDEAIASGRHWRFIVERFTITGRTAQNTPQYDALYIIGAIDYLASKLGMKVDFQLPSEAMNFSTDDKLRAAGWYIPGEGHANDASRHLLLWFDKNRPTLPLAQRILAQVAERIGLAP